MNTTTPSRSARPRAAVGLVAVLGGLAASVALAQAPAAGTSLAAPSQRITDGVIQRDHAVYEAMQARLKAINERGRPLRDYHLAKAQCWLDVSFHEYTRNDRSAFPQGALDQGDALARLMEQATGVAPLNGPWDTPLLNDAARLRPDLWARTEALRGRAGWACAAAQAACAEVELVHAGNEFNQQQWRHAKPYVQIAEDLIAEAEQRANRCEPPPAPPPPPPVVVVPPPPPAPPAPPPLQSVQLAAAVLFEFDRAGTGDMRAFSVQQLDELIDRARRDGLRIERVRLVGHADRLNSTGQGAYNDELSRRRVETVRAHLVGRGVDASSVVLGHQGDTRPVVACTQPGLGRAALHECLLPNRRVEVVIEAVRPAPR